MPIPQTINDLTPVQRQQLMHRLGQLHMAIQLLCEPWRDDMPDVIDELRRDAKALAHRIELMQQYLR